MKAIAYLGVACGALSFTACSALVGIGDLPSVDGGGGGGAVSADAVRPFLATWATTANSTATVVCNGNSEANPDDFSFTMTRGVASDLIANTQGCNLKLNISGARTASLVAGQTCTQTSNGEAFQFTYSGGTFAVSADGASASLDLTGTATVTTATGSATCTYSQSDEFTKQ